MQQNPTSTRSEYDSTQVNDRVKTETKSRLARESSR